MAEDRIIKFCARVGPRKVSLVMINCPPSGRGQGHIFNLQNPRIFIYLFTPVT